MAPSTPIDDQVLRAPDTALCTRSLAALPAASPYQRSPKATSSSGSDIMKFESPRLEIAKAVCTMSTPLSDGGKSTDEADLSDSHVDNQSIYQSTEWIGCAASTEVDSVLSSPRTEATSVSQKLHPFVAMYPVALLLQLRAAICRDSGDSSALGYGTRDASACPAGDAGSTEKRQHASVASLPEASENSWAARQRASSGVDDNEQVARAARSILNKLTVEKFASLSEQLTMCGVRTPAHVKILMHEIFEKAVAQHKFLAMYADLCVKLESDPRIVPAVEAAGRPNSFRRLLLNQCQQAFEQQLDDGPVGVQNDDDEEERIIGKQRTLGNMKFVGELMVRGMLSSTLLCNCGEELLRGQANSPAACESLAALLTVAGPKFDSPSWPHFERLDAIFDRIQVTVNDKTVPTRLRFLLRDVLDLRKSGWADQSRSPLHGAAPMRLEAVRAAASETSVVKASAGGKNDKGSSQNSAPQSPHKSTKKSMSATILPKPSSPAVKEAPQCPQKSTKKSMATEGRPASSSQALKEVKKAMSMEIPPTSSSNGASSSGAHRRAANASCIVAAADRTNGRDEKPSAVTAPSSAHGSPKEVASKPIPADSAATSAQKIPDQTPSLPSSNSTASDTARVPAPNPVAPFNPSAYHREVSATLRELSSTRNVPAAVRRIRAQHVPLEHQEREFADLLTRASEEVQGIARRTFLAFCAGIVAGGTFGSTECLSGVGTYFKEIYPDLCEEVDKLPAIAMTELLPTLRTVMDAASLTPLVPRELRRAMQSVRPSA